jgi:hypothetical protein
MKRRLRAGAFPGAVQDDTGAWVIGVDDLLAAGFHLNRSTPVTPVSDRSPQVTDLGQRIADLERQLLEERHARLTEQIRREAAEQIAAEREKRAQTAERALLMLESREAREARAPVADVPPADSDGDRPELAPSTALPSPAVPPQHRGGGATDGSSGVD